jgi:hypothetical protein
LSPIIAALRLINLFVSVRTLSVPYRSAAGLCDLTFTLFPAGFAPAPISIKRQLKGDDRNRDEHANG